MLASGGFGVDCSRLKCMRKKRTYRYKCCSINALKTKHRSAGDLNVQSLSRLYFGSNAAWQWQVHVVVYQDITVSKSKVITRLRKRNICSTASICVASVCRSTHSFQLPSRAYCGCWLSKLRTLNPLVFPKVVWGSDHYACGSIRASGGGRALVMQFRNFTGGAIETKNEFFDLTWWTAWFLRSRNDFYTM